MVLKAERCVTVALVIIYYDMRFYPSALLCRLGPLHYCPPSKLMWFRYLTRPSLIHLEDIFAKSWIHKAAIWTELNLKSLLFSHSIHITASHSLSLVLLRASWNFIICSEQPNLNNFVKYYHSIHANCMQSTIECFDSPLYISRQTAVDTSTSARWRWQQKV